MHFNDLFEDLIPPGNRIAPTQRPRAFLPMSRDDENIQAGVVHAPSSMGRGAAEPGVALQTRRDDAGPSRTARQLGSTPKLDEARLRGGLAGPAHGSQVTLPMSRLQEPVGPGIANAAGTLGLNAPFAEDIGRLQAGRPGFVSRAMPHERRDEVLAARAAAITRLGLDPGRLAQLLTSGAGGARPTSGRMQPPMAPFGTRPSLPTSSDDRIRFVSGDLGRQAQTSPIDAALARITPARAPNAGHEDGAAVDDQEQEAFIRLAQAQDPEIRDQIRDRGNEMSRPLRTEGVYDTIRRFPRAMLNSVWQEAARSSIRRAIRQRSTTPSARRVLTSFVTGAGPRSFYFGPSSDGVRELFRGYPSGYFRREEIEAMNYMAYDQDRSRGYLQDGDEVTGYNFRPAGPLEYAGLRDGVQMGDITGTFSGGIDARVRGNRVYFRAVNRMNMASFAQANLIPLQNRLIDLPSAGPLSEVEMIFEWSRPIPARLRPRRRR